MGTAYAAPQPQQSASWLRKVLSRGTEAVQTIPPHSQVALRHKLIHMAAAYASLGGGIQKSLRTPVPLVQEMERCSQLPQACLPAKLPATTGTSSLLNTFADRIHES